MNELTNFNFESHEVRMVLIDGEPWFVAADVCLILDIDTTQTRRLDEDEKGLRSIQTPGGTQDMLCVNESGLYSLVLGSRKPEAKTFKRWITHEVVPSIRKTGAYSVEPSIDISRLDPQTRVLYMAVQEVAKTQIELKETRKELSEVKESVRTIQETFLQRDPDWRNSINSLLNGASFRSKVEYRDLRTQSYQLLEERGHCDLNARLRNLKKRLEDAGATKTQINQANRMDVIDDDARLKEIYTTVVKEISIGSMRVVGETVDAFQGRG